MDEKISSATTDLWSNQAHVETAYQWAQAPLAARAHWIDEALAADASEKSMRHLGFVMKLETSALIINLASASADLQKFGRMSDLPEDLRRDFFFDEHGHEVFSPHLSLRNWWTSAFIHAQDALQEDAESGQWRPSTYVHRRMELQHRMYWFASEYFADHGWDSLFEDQLRQMVLFEAEQMKQIPDGCFLFPKPLALPLLIFLRGEALESAFQEARRLNLQRVPSQRVTQQIDGAFVRVDTPGDAILSGYLIAVTTDARMSPRIPFNATARLFETQPALRPRVAQREGEAK